MDQKGIKKAALGIRYLLKYASHPNMAYILLLKSVPKK